MNENARVISTLQKNGLQGPVLGYLEKKDALFVLTQDHLIYEDEKAKTQGAVKLKDLTRIHSSPDGTLRVETHNKTTLYAHLSGFNITKINQFFALVREATANVKQRNAQNNSDATSSVASAAETEPSPPQEQLAYKPEMVQATSQELTKQDKKPAQEQPAPEKTQATIQGTKEANQSATRSILEQANPLPSVPKGVPIPTPDIDVKSRRVANTSGTVDAERTPSPSSDSGSSRVSAVHTTDYPDPSSVRPTVRVHRNERNATDQPQATVKAKRSHGLAGLSTLSAHGLFSRSPKQQDPDPMPPSSPSPWTSSQAQNPPSSLLPSRHLATQAKNKDTKEKQSKGGLLSHIPSFWRRGQKTDQNKPTGPLLLPKKQQVVVTSQDEDAHARTRQQYFSNFDHEDPNERLLQQAQQNQLTSLGTDPTSLVTQPDFTHGLSTHPEHAPAPLDTGVRVTGQPNATSGSSAATAKTPANPSAPAHSAHWDTREDDNYLFDPSSSAHSSSSAPPTPKTTDVRSEFFGEHGIGRARLASHSGSDLPTPSTNTQTPANAQPKIQAATSPNPAAAVSASSVSPMPSLSTPAARVEDATTAPSVSANSTNSPDWDRLAAAEMSDHAYPAAFQPGSLAETTVKKLHNQADYIQIASRNLKILGNILFFGAVALAAYMFFMNQMSNALFVLIFGAVGGVVLWIAGDVVHLIVLQARAVGAMNMPLGGDPSDEDSDAASHG